MTFPTRVIGGLGEIAVSYDAFILDLWGCLHDGVRIYPAALDCLHRLKDTGKTAIILSNAPRRVSDVEKRIAGIAANQDVLVRRAWSKIPVMEMIEAQLRSLGESGEQVSCQGPEVNLSPGAAEALAMAFHEMGTNALKYGSLAGLALLAFTSPSGTLAHFTPAWSGGLDLSLLATALIAIMWTYDGWADLSFMGGEVRDPGRTLPMALILGTTGIVLVYLLLNFAYIYLVPLSEMAASPLVAATAAERIPLFAGAGGAVVSGVVMVSCLGALTGSMMTGPRIFFAMADRGLFFRTIARVSPRFQSPSVAIWLATALGTVYVLLNDFQQLADKFILGIWPFYALAVAAVFVLRRTRPDLPRPYRTWGYPLVPVLFLLASLGMVLNALLTDPVNTGVTFGIILAGIPVYYVWRAVAGARAVGRAAAPESSRAP